MKNKITLLLFFFVLHSFFTKAQTEFLVTVDPATGTHTIINNLPGINFISMNATAYDKTNKRYMLYGLDFSGDNRLYCIDAVTGTILSQPLVTYNAGEFHYDNTLHKLFGLYINNTINKMFVVSFDLPTGALTVVDTLPVVGYSTGGSAYDEANHRFITQRPTALYYSDVTSGVTTGITTATSYNSLQYDNATATLFGLKTSPSQLVTINTGTGAYTTVGTLSASGYSSMLVTFDEINHRYTIGSSSNLYTLNATTGATVYSPSFPGVPPGENIIELHYDNSTGVLYGLHWGATPTGITELNADNNATLYPNPFSETATLAFKNPGNNTFELSIFDAAGKLAMVRSNISGTSVTIDRKDLPPGIYCYSLKSSAAKQISLTGKFVIE